MASERTTLEHIWNTQGESGLNPVQIERMKELQTAGAQGNPRGEHQRPGDPTSFGSTSGAGMGIGTTSGVPDLSSLYTQYLKDSGIATSQAQFDALGNQITQRQNAQNAAQAKINDNPFYSEGTRVGRSAKLTEQFNNDVRGLTDQQTLLQNKIATQKADVETKLNIQTKQFDINSQAATNALNQFNTLLSTGALDNASGEDIANLTRSTGISSDMIYSAVNAQKAKNVQTQTVQYDDGVNQGFAVINSQTGDIVSRQVVAASSSVQEQKNALEQLQAKEQTSGGGGLTVTETRKVVAAATKSLTQGSPENSPHNYTGKDKYLSYNEYLSYIADIIADTGVDYDTANNILGTQATSLGYKKWGSGWPK